MYCDELNIFCSSIGIDPEGGQWAQKIRCEGTQ